MKRSIPVALLVFSACFPINAEAGLNVKKVFDKVRQHPDFLQLKGALSERLLNLSMSLDDLDESTIDGVATECRELIQELNLGVQDAGWRLESNLTKSRDKVRQIREDVSEHMYQLQQAIDRGDGDSLMTYKRRLSDSLKLLSILLVQV